MKKICDPKTKQWIQKRINYQFESNSFWFQFSIELHFNSQFQTNQKQKKIFFFLYVFFCIFFPNWFHWCKTNDKKSNFNLYNVSFLCIETIDWNLLYFPFVLRIFFFFKLFFPLIFCFFKKSFELHLRFETKKINLKNLIHLKWYCSIRFSKFFRFFFFDYFYSMDIFLVGFFIYFLW